MALSAGHRLATFEILAALGAGGMGEVYRARDLKLGRDVAIKVLPVAFLTDPERRGRFQREAQLLAALNHPHIASVFGLEESGETTFLAMELVEGESLADRVQAGALGPDESLQIARQIGEALAAAHDKGIIHRDLKPANVMLTSDGRVKVLDFGLAKMLEGPAGAISATLSPTLSLQATMAGTILGTAAYMSPEQARGRAVDKRTDIWAFGVVLYEMLTGRRAFEGDDVSSILAAVIKSEPRWDGVPASVRRLLESCLEKDPKKRLRDIGDAWKLLDDQVAPTQTQTGVLGWAVAALVALVAAAALWAPWRGTPTPAAQPILRLEAGLGDGFSLATLAIPTVSSVVISPDGTRLVYVGNIS